MQKKVDTKLMDTLVNDLLVPLIKKDGRIPSSVIHSIKASTKLAIFYPMMNPQVKDKFMNDVVLWCQQKGVNFDDVWNAGSQSVYYYTRRYLATNGAILENKKSTIENINATDYSERLNGLIPPPSVWANYISRKIEGEVDMDILLKAYQSNPPDNVMLEGHCGTGKNVMIRAFCSHFKIPLYRFNFNGCSTPDQLFGYKTIDGDGKVVWVDGPVTRLMRYGGVCVGDEIHSAREDVLFALFQVLDERQTLLPENDAEVVVANPKFMFVATTNPDTYAGVRKSNPAFKDRFPCWLNIPNDETVEKRLIRNKNVLQMANILRDAYSFGIFGDAPVSTRQLVNLDNNIKKYGSRLAMKMFIDRYIGQVDSDVMRILSETSGIATENDPAFNNAMEKIRAVVKFLTRKV